MGDVPLVSVAVRETRAGFVTMVVIGGIEFRRTARDEAEAARVAMEVQGFFESRLNVEFDPPMIAP